MSLLGGASAYAMDLAAINELAAAGVVEDYKAIVCVFLDGGNDHANTLIPYDQDNYLLYQQLRGGGANGEMGVALTKEALQSSVLFPNDEQQLTDGIQYALAPTMPKLTSRFHQCNLAILLNTGPLETPLTKAQFLSDNRASYPVPKKLFSHNDQQSAWQTSTSADLRTGWGGRMADLAQSRNSNSMFTALSISGNGVFLRGQDSMPFRLSTKGALTPAALKYSAFGMPSASDALNQILRQSGGTAFQQDIVRINSRSVDYGLFLNEILEKSQYEPSIGGTALAQQLEVVAKMIDARQQVGVKRQVFMVSIGGFDHHGGLRGSHDALLGQLDNALDNFFAAMLGLGLSDNVTLFTASDFGRTLSVNGDGSDHGWGGHHFVLGGAVNGGRFFGTAPRTSIESDDQVGRGRLLPTISVDELSTTLAKWFGVPESELTSIAPNIGRFRSPDLGFMQSS
nr:DUF1501 domain-containing protein [Altererythrobacter lutimaris]